ncbi:MAG: O-antigen ligase family protein [Saprospiraceae bacterium]
MMSFLNDRLNIALFFSCLLVASIVTSPFLLTLSMIALLLLSFVSFPKEGNGKFELNTTAFQRITNYQQHLSLLVISLFFGIVLFSGWQTVGNYDYLLERLRIKLPFLILPIAFLGLPKFTSRYINHLLYFLLLFMTLMSIGIGIYYFLHFSEVQHGLSRGHAMPTPRNHIRHSLLTAISILGGLHLIMQKYCWKSEKEKRLIKFLTFFFFFFIHVLSVKSGLVCLYFSLGVLLLRYIYVSRKYVLGAGLLLGLLLIPFIAYHSIPSLKQKIGYMFYDLAQHQKGEGAIYADSGRIISFKAGVELFKRNPVFGVGVGNFRREVNELYAEQYPDYVQALMPHNQFLFVLASTGLFGLGLFLVAFFLPLFYKKAYRNFFFLGFYMLSLMAFLLEHTIENAAGVATFSFFVILLPVWLRPTDRLDNILKDQPSGVSPVKNFSRKTS